MEELAVKEEWYLLRPESNAQRAAREQFLQTIKDKAPNVLRSLADDVLPLYKAVYDWERESGKKSFDHSLSLLSGFAIKDLASPFTIIHPESPNFYGKREKEVKQFQHALRQWAERWHLIDYWFLDVVERTLKRWSQLKALRQLDWSHEGEYTGGFLIDKVISFEFMTWDVETEPWKEYEKRFLEAVKDWLRKYHDEKLRMGLRNKKRIARDKRERSHFVWLVEYQVNELPITSRRGNSIVSGYSGANSLDHTTVSEAINSLASLIGLTLRPLKRGRPRRFQPVL